MKFDLYGYFALLIPML